MFFFLDKPRVPTGLLKDFAFELIDFESYNGQTLSEDNCMNSTNFEFLLRTIRSSAVLTPPFKPVTEILNDMAEDCTQTTIPVGYALFRYNYIKENAVSDSLLLIINNMVIDYYCNGEWQNPYDTGTIFGFSPVNNIVRSGTITFDFSSYAFTNTEIQSLFFDAGDGAGYRAVSQQLSIPYAEGEYTLKLKAILNDNSIYESHSKLWVSAIIDDYHLNGGSQTEPPRLNIPLGEPYNGVITSADIFINYASPDHKIRKPFIIVEGFDIRFSSNDLGYSNYSQYLNDTTIMNQLQGYDVIYVDWIQNEEYIQANGNLLISLIDFVNQQKELSGSNEYNVIYGFSMGGLIARYALCKMEQQSRDHQTLFYISHDTPHLGANIPLGALYAIHSIISFYKGYTNAANLSDLLPDINLNLGYDPIELIYKYLYSNAAKQMLINYVSPSGVLDNLAHGIWQNELREMGFPKGLNGHTCYCKCITNGGAIDLSAYSDHYLYASANAYGNWIFNTIVTIAGILRRKEISTILNELFNGQFDSNTLFKLGSHSIDGTFLIKPFTSSGCNVFETNIVYTKNTSWKEQTLQRTIFSSCKNAPNAFAVDAVNGSYFDLSNVKQFLPNSPQYINTNYGKATIEIDMTDKIMFIPTASSLCIGKGELDLPSACRNNDYFVNPNYVLETPFCGVLRDTSLLGNASYHISRINKMFEWALIPPINNIVGPQIPNNGDQYYVYPYKDNIQWSTSDATIASISNDGRIEISGSGYLTIFAMYNNNGHLYSASKRIMVGLPEFTLSTIKSSIDYSVIVQATPIIDENEDFELPNDIIYQWGTLINGEIIWNTMESYKTTTMTTVYFRALYKNYTSSVYSLLVIPPSKPIIIPPTPNFPILNVTNSGQIIDTSLENDIIKVKSSNSEAISYTFTIENYKFHFEGIPSARQLLNEMLKYDYFVNLIKQLKPWSTDQILLLKLAYSTSNQYNGETILKLVYKDSL